MSKFYTFPLLSINWSRLPFADGTAFVAVVKISADRTNKSIENHPNSRDNFHENEEEKPREMATLDRRNDVLTMNCEKQL